MDRCRSGKIVVVFAEYRNINSHPFVLYIILYVTVMYPWLYNQFQ